MTVITPLTIPKPDQIPTVIHLISGAISGATSVICLQPLDLIKTRVQQEHYRIEPIASTSKLPFTSPTPSLSAIPIVTPGHKVITDHITHNQSKSRRKTKIWSTARSVIQRDGVRGLWRGTIPTLYRNVPGVSLYFLSLAKLRTLLGQSHYFTPTSSAASALARTTPTTTTNGKIKLSPTGDLLVGSTARTGVGFILMPATLLKTLSESSLVTTTSSSTTKIRPSSFHLLASVYRSGGIKALWRGSVPTALRDAPGAGLFMVFYERSQTFFSPNNSNNSNNTSKKGSSSAVGGGLSGATASLASTLLTTPFDLLKTRRQLSPTLYPTFLASVKRVYTTGGGITAFWQGASLRVARKAGSAAVGWAVYESVLGGWETKMKARLKED